MLSRFVSKQHTPIIKSVIVMLKCLKLFPKPNL